MSKYIEVYETLCPDDPIVGDGPRRPSIIAEMRAIHTAKTEAQAGKIIEWWNSWPNPQHQNALEFVREARKMLSTKLPKG